MLQLDWGRPQSDVSECWRSGWTGESNSSSKERPQCFRYQEPYSRLLLRNEFHRSTVTELPEWGGGFLDLELDHRKVLASRLLLKYGWCSRGLKGFANLDAEAPTKAGWAFRGESILVRFDRFPVDCLPVCEQLAPTNQHGYLGSLFHQRHHCPIQSSSHYP